jgi:hypothetical protein
LKSGKKALFLQTKEGWRGTKQILKVLEDSRAKQAPLRLKPLLST